MDLGVEDHDAVAWNTICGSPPPGTKIPSCLSEPNAAEHPQITTCAARASPLTKHPSNVCEQATSTKPYSETSREKPRSTAELEHIGKLASPLQRVERSPMNVRRMRARGVLACSQD